MVFVRCLIDRCHGHGKRLGLKAGLYHAFAGGSFFPADPDDLHSHGFRKERGYRELRLKRKPAPEEIPDLPEKQNETMLPTRGSTSQLEKKTDAARQRYADMLKIGSGSVVIGR